MPKPPDSLTADIRRLEDALDEVNIRIQRQLAEREVDKIAREKAEKEAEKKKSGFWGSWFGGGSSSSSASSDDGESGGAIGINIKKLEEALTFEEKSSLYEVIDYQENAHHGVFPKRFVARKLGFRLGSLNVTIRDEDWNDATVMRLELLRVACDIGQRPSADYLCVEMTMESLTVSGLESKYRKQQVSQAAPVLVATRSSGGGSSNDRLLNLSFQTNPPENPAGNLDTDEGSVYDQRVRFFSCPLEIVYDKNTFDRLERIFKAPELVNLSNLQHNAASKLREYREATSLSLQYVIDNHNLVDIDIQLMSSYVIVPHKGVLTSSSACAIANLGSIRVKSSPVSVETRSLRELSLSDLTEAFKRNLRDQAYDKFSVSLENMQVIVALPNENWRTHVEKDSSPLFLLKPTSLKVTLHQCLIRNDPDMPLTKLKGSLASVSINISDYRLIKLAQIVDSILDSEAESDGQPGNLQRADSEASMASALSSLNTGSMLQNTAASTMLTNIVPKSKTASGEAADDDAAALAKASLTKFTLDFTVGKVNLSLSQMVKGSANSDEQLFHFTLSKLEAHARVRSLDFIGQFNIGCVACEHLMLKTPDGKTVQIVSVCGSEPEDRDGIHQFDFKS
jgi:vacuolar protein sorting-associated protein 13A/C